MVVRGGWKWLLEGGGIRWLKSGGGVSENQTTYYHGAYHINQSTKIPIITSNEG